jgi:hypothetical protein
MAYSRVGKIIEEIRGKPLPEPVDPWKNHRPGDRPPSPVSQTLYGLEMHAREKERRRLSNCVRLWFWKDRR